MNILAADTGWFEANQRYISAALALVRYDLKRHIENQQGTQGAKEQPRASEKALQEAACAMPAPSALDTLCTAFGLSPFEHDILLLCAGIEMESSFSSMCAAAQGNPLKTYPTFSLALAALPDPHWSALAPIAPLRRWRLIEIGTGGALTLSPLRIDERVLHYLAGVQHPDERLAGIIEPLHTPGDLVPSHRKLAEKLTRAWSQAAGISASPVVQLCGSDVESKRAIAGVACASLGLKLNIISATVIPQSPGELESLIRLWEREAALSSSALLVDCDNMDTTDPVRERAIARLIERTSGALVVTSRERRSSHNRPVITFDVWKPDSVEQRTVWQSTLGTSALNLNGRVETLVPQFNLSTHTIRSICVEAMGSPPGDDRNPDELGDVLWDACRMQTRPHLNDLAQRIEPAAAWDDLVLPDQNLHILREIALHVRLRFKVYETWGFAGKGSRGLGISALFTGSSGTGKTMAAEVLANELKLDLYRIDLSQMVSKYIGETEKNLRRVFDAAEEGGAILLFDEADALFGKRSEVKDSHDRYANIEISYLLQRMEAYRGLAILTTNMKSALDTAFLRRIRFIVQFPFPDASQRVEIWRRVFPISTPTNGLDVERLAKLNVTGGNIRNIALNAAFLAADEGEPVSMMHLLHATHSECARLEKPLTEAEIGGWV